MLDISIDNKHQRIENAEKAISEFIRSKMANVFVELCVSGVFICKSLFAKTDKLDAKLLEKNDEVIEHIVSQKQEELKELRAIERNLSDEVHANMCRLHKVKPGNI